MGAFEQDAEIFAGWRQAITVKTADGRNRMELSEAAGLIRKIRDYMERYEIAWPTLRDKAGISQEEAERLVRGAAWNRDVPYEQTEFLVVSLYQGGWLVECLQKDVEGATAVAAQLRSCGFAACQVMSKREYLEKIWHERGA